MSLHLCLCVCLRVRLRLCMCLCVCLCLCLLASHTDSAVARTQRKDDYAPPYEAIRALITDRHVLPQCFAASDELRGMLLRMLYCVQSLEDSAFAAQPLASKASVAPRSDRPPAKPPISAQRVITIHLETEWPDLVAAIRAIRRAPPALSANGRHRIDFLSHFTTALTTLQAPVPKAWQPLPASFDEWS